MERLKVNPSNVVKLLLLTLGLVMVSGVGVFKGAYTQAGNQRKVTARHFRDTPVKVKEVRNFQKGEEWFRDLEIEVQNVSDDPIYFMEVSIEFPNVPAPTPTPRPDNGFIPKSVIGFTIMYGAERLVNVYELAGPDDVPLKPGGTYVFKIPEASVMGFEYMKKEKKNLSPKIWNKVVIGYGVINFGDGIGFPRGQRVSYSKKVGPKPAGRKTAPPLVSNGRGNQLPSEFSKSTSEDAKKDFSDDDLKVKDQKPHGKLAVVIETDMDQFHDATSPVAVGAVQSLAGGGKYAGVVKIKRLEIKNRSSKDLNSVQLRWEIASLDNPARVLLEGTTPFVNFWAEADSSKVVEIPTIYPALLFKPLAKDNELNGQFQLTIGVQEARFADGSFWRRKETMTESNAPYFDWSPSKQFPFLASILPDIPPHPAARPARRAGAQRVPRARGVRPPTERRQRRRPDK